MTGEQLGIPPALLDPAELPRAACAYCRLGFSIVPAAAEGKRALVSWKRWQAQAADLELVERWWRRWPAANVAVVTGRLSGVVVVDIDPRHGGDRALAILESEHGDLPHRAMVETPSGGTHIYLAHPGYGIPNSAGRLGPGIDVRGDRGLALLPPSRRGLGSYRWAIGDPTTVPSIPNAWRRLQAPRPKPAVAGAGTASGRAQGTGRGWWDPGGHRDAARLAGLLRALQRAPEGQRNGTLYWCGKRLAEMLAEGAPESWVEVLVRAGVAAGLEPGECRSTVASALGREP